MLAGGLSTHPEAELGRIDERHRIHRKQLEDSRLA